ncbi:MAG: glycosyltransferase family 2 protein [Actinomycetota bacterium]|nr:glycosyltransferase family 2 protein [Actinomycetota bacterium]
MARRIESANGNRRLLGLRTPDDEPGTQDRNRPTPERPLISVVVPCFNEEEVLRETYLRLTAILTMLAECAHEIVFVDDGSRDRTWQLMVAIAESDSRVRLVRLSRNFGHQACLIAGLHEARGDAVVMMDADLQDPPELIPELVQQWRIGYHVVSAHRSAREGETYFKRATAFVFYRVLRTFADQPIAVDTGDFRLLDRSVVDIVISLHEHRPFLRGQISWAGFEETTVGYVRAARQAGDSKYCLRDMLNLSGGALASCTMVPGRLPTTVGLTLLGAATVLRTVFRRRVPASVWSFAGQTLLLGAVAQQTHLVFNQVRGRPSYIIRQRFSNCADQVTAITNGGRAAADEGR